jgi:hypothetical protein
VNPHIDPAFPHHAWQDDVKLFPANVVQHVRGPIRIVTTEGAVVCGVDAGFRFGISASVASPLGRGDGRAEDGSDEDGTGQCQKAARFIHVIIS